MPTPSAIDSWLSSHGALVAALGTLSVLLLAVTVFATPWLLGRLPADYFRTPDEETDLPRRGPWRWLLLAARNVAGAALFVIGLLMIVTPGPGLVAMLLGLSLCRFPGKHALLRRLAARPDVFASLNWIRRRRDAAPFEHPYAGESERAEVRER